MRCDFSSNMHQVQIGGHKILIQVSFALYNQSSMKIIKLRKMWLLVQRGIVKNGEILWKFYIIVK